MSRTVCFTERIISCWGYPLTQHTIWWKNNSMQIFFWTKVYPNKVLGNKTEHSVEIVTLDSRYIIEWQLVRLDIYPPGVWWSTPGSASPSASCDTAAPRMASGPRRSRRGPSAARAARAAPSRTSWGDMAWRIFYRMIVILFSEDSQNFWRSKYQV